MVERVVELEDLSGIALAIDANVIVTPSDTQKVTIKGQQNIIDNIIKSIKSDGVWFIG